MSASLGNKGVYASCPCGSGKKFKFCCHGIRKSGEGTVSPSGILADLGPNVMNDERLFREGIRNMMKDYDFEKDLPPELRDVVVDMAVGMQFGKEERVRERITTDVSPDLPGGVVDLSDSYPRPDPVQVDGERVTLPMLSLPDDREGDVGEMEELMEARWPAYEAVLRGWGDHLEKHLGLRVDELNLWGALFFDYLGRFLPVYQGTTVVQHPHPEEMLRRYLGNYYVRKHLDCNLGDMYHGLKGFASLYVYLRHLGVLDEGRAREAVETCRDVGFFKRRFVG